MTRRWRVCVRVGHTARREISQTKDFILACLPRAWDGYTAAFLTGVRIA